MPCVTIVVRDPGLAGACTVRNSKSEYALEYKCKDAAHSYGYYYLGLKDASRNEASLQASLTLKYVRVIRCVFEE